MPAPAPVSVAPSAAGALVIFLSSTIGDYEALRREVRDVLLRKAECACFLSEDWVGGYDATVQKCRQRVLESGGFILLLGYWYGSIPPGKQKSITHLEFEWALEKWKGEPFPKMAVLKPKPGSAAEKKLQALAGKLLPQTEPERDKHALRLAQFQAQVDDKHVEWRTIRTFENGHDLREHALVIGKDWRGYTPLAAACGQLDAEIDDAEPQLREDQLGRLGREPQHTAIKKLLAGMAAYPEAPAAAFLVHGDEDEGQRAFLAYVVTSLLKNHYPKRKIGRLPPSSSSRAALVAWVAKTLALENTIGMDSPQALAAGVVEELKHQPLYFVIDRIGADYAGGVAAFQKDFWQPFCASLQTLRTEQHVANRLVAIVTDYAHDATAWAGAAAEPKAGVPIDFSKLVPVPRLEHFQQSDLFDWFEELDVPDVPAGRRAQLAQRALKDEDSGELDGTPQRVFNRLMSERLWPEGDNP